MCNSESGATFLNIKASSILDKWLGETDHLVTAMFKLARKLGPSVIFIDEIETLLKSRSGASSSPGITSMQGVFLSEWDGLVVNRNDLDQPTAPVVVLGATNRPNDLDAAFLRRMPVKIQTKMPNEQDRVAILKALLKDEILDADVDLGDIAIKTENYSGSDLRELVRIATLRQAKELNAALKTRVANLLQSPPRHSNNKSTPVIPRPLNNEDFQYAYEKTRLTGNELN